MVAVSIEMTAQTDKLSSWGPHASAKFIFIEFQLRNISNRYVSFVAFRKNVVGDVFSAKGWKNIDFETSLLACRNSGGDRLSSATAIKISNWNNNLTTQKMWPCNKRFECIWQPSAKSSTNKLLPYHIRHVSCCVFFFFLSCSLRVELVRAVLLNAHKILLIFTRQIINISVDTLISALKIVFCSAMEWRGNHANDRMKEPMRMLSM